MPREALVRHGLCYFLRWFVRLRWVAVVAASLATTAAWALLHLDFPYPALYGVIGLIATYNLGFAWLLERRRPCESQRQVLLDRNERLELETACKHCNARVAMAQTVLDLLALFALLHLSGGVENPLLLFFLFHVVLSGILLRRREALLMTTLAVSLCLLLAVLERAGLLPHYHPHVFAGELLSGSWSAALGIPAAFAATAALLAYLTQFVMSELRRRSDQVIALGQNLERTNGRLERIDQMRRQLLAIATHDLKSPVAAVTSYLSLLAGGYLGEVNEKQQEILERSLLRLRSLSAFLADILDVTRVEKGELRQALRPMDPLPVLRRALEDAQDSAQLKHIEFEVALAERGPELLVAPERLAQVFANLLSNAIKYSPEGSKVWVRATEDEGGLLVEVKDQGIGMSPEDLKQLFTRFFRAPRARELGVEGTGVGLYFVHLLVEAHGGRIWAESEVGRGSSFFVRLPAPGAPRRDASTTVF